MYEKLCAILDALRERGMVCKAVMNGPAGTWEIVGQCEVSAGIYKVFSIDLPVRYVRYNSAYDCIRQVLGEVGE